MTSNEFESSIKKCSCYCSDLPPLITTGIAIGSVLTTASILNPKVRKITIPILKYTAKQQLRLLAGIGVLSIATYIANSQSETIN